MRHLLTDRTIFFHWQTPALVGVFFVLRFLSYILIDHAIIQSSIVFILLMIMAMLYFYNPMWAWFLLLGELLLGGAGIFLEIAGLSLRSALLMTFLGLWLVHGIATRQTRFHMHIHHVGYYLILPFLIFVLFATTRGLIVGNDAVAVFQDLVPFLYFLLLLPAYYLFQEAMAKEYVIRLLGAFLISSALFSLLLFVLFSTGIAEVHDPLYNWLRDAAAAKITDTGTGFFRIVRPEHLFIVPVMLLIISLTMKDERHHLMWRLLLVCGAIVLALDFSRIYWLALFIGILFLLTRHTWKKWMQEGILAVLSVVGLFFMFHLLASGTLGLGLFGTRLGSFAQPYIETSTQNRMELLPAIREQIVDHPLLGNGLGSSLTSFHASTQTLQTTRHYDWGYLELWAELGLFGLLAFLVYIGYLFRGVIQKIRVAPSHEDFYVGLLGMLVALVVMTITSPALFHVFGILCLIFITVFVLKPHDIFDTLVVHLYRIFNKL